MLLVLSASAQSVSLTANQSTINLGQSITLNASEMGASSPYSIAIYNVSTGLPLGSCLPYNPVTGNYTCSDTPTVSTTYNAILTFGSTAISSQSVTVTVIQPSPVTSGGGGPTQDTSAKGCQGCIFNLSDVPPPSAFPVYIGLSPPTTNTTNIINATANLSSNAPTPSNVTPAVSQPTASNSIVDVGQPVTATTNTTTAVQQSINTTSVSSVTNTTANTTAVQKPQTNPINATVAGIAVGIVVAVILLGIYFLYIRRPS